VQTRIAKGVQRARFALFALALVASCDPTLSMSTRRGAKRTIEGCPEAVTHLKECCPLYESFLSCTVIENEYGGAGSPDLSARQSRCVRERECGAIEKAVKSGDDICGVTLSGRRCR
jgi:hypothetical protein